MAHQHGSRCPQPGKSRTLGPGRLTCRWDPGGFLGFPHAQSTGEKSPRLKHKNTGMSPSDTPLNVASVTSYLFFSASILIFSPSYHACSLNTHPSLGRKVSSPADRKRTLCGTTCKTSNSPLEGSRGPGFSPCALPSRAAFLHPILQP